MTRVGELLYKKGRQEGMKEGLEEGKQEGMKEAARNLLKMGIEMEKIIQDTGLTEEEVKQLKSE